nr:HDOD domain-containing protein [Coralloluteibacterium stylophorae]
MTVGGSADTHGRRSWWERWWPRRPADDAQPGPGHEALDAADGVGDADLLAAEALEIRFLCHVLGIAEPAPQDAPVSPRRPRDREREEPVDADALPRLPTVIPQLLQAMRSSKASGEGLARLLARDPALVVEVLRAANSAHYGAARAITSVRGAVVMLGEEGLRRVIARVMTRPIHTAGSGPSAVAGARLWTHAERCAEACAALAPAGGAAFEAFLAGIVCNIGAMTLMRGDAGLPAQPDAQDLEDFGLRCRRAAHQVARQWGLPPGVVEALAVRAGLSRVRTPLAPALVAADRLAMAAVLAEAGRLETTSTPPVALPQGFAPAALARAWQLARRPQGDAEL